MEGRLYVDRRLAVRSCPAAVTTVDDKNARRGVFDELGRTSKRALIISEGLLVYLPADEVCALATDLARQPSFSAWATDLTNPALLKMLQRQVGSCLREAGSPLQFGPEEGPRFFERCAWKPAEVHGMLHDAAHCETKTCPSLVFLLRNEDLTLYLSLGHEGGLFVTVGRRATPSARHHLPRAM